MFQLFRKLIATQTKIFDLAINAEPAERAKLFFQRDLYLEKMVKIDKAIAMMRVSAINQQLLGNSNVFPVEKIVEVLDKYLFEIFKFYR